MNDANMDRAMAILRSGRSYEEAARSTGLDVKAVMKAWADAHPVNDHQCPICADPFKPDDLCADDIEMGSCHAACLGGSPVVDLDTGQEIKGGVLDTYPWSDVSV